MFITNNLIISEPSLFQGHLLEPIHTTPIFREGTTSYWTSIILFIVFALYASIKAYDSKKMLQVLSSVFSLQAAKQLIREDYKFNKRLSVILSVGFVFMLSFFLYIINNYFGLILKATLPFKQFLFFVSVVVLMYSLKFLVNYLLSEITDIPVLGKEYSFNIFVFSQTIGIILFPLILSIQYSKFPVEWFLYPAIVVFMGFFVLRLTRGFVISILEQNIGILYIFLYLCALEILPVLVLIKFLLNNF